MLAVAFTSDPAPYITALRNNGLLVMRAGDNAIRFLPALNASQSEISEAIGLFEQTLANF